MRIPVIIIIGIHIATSAEFFQISGTGRRSAPFSGAVQSREQNCGKNRDYRDNNEEFNKSKAGKLYSTMVE